MAIVYYDMVNGNNTSGNGTYSLPYKTLTKAVTGLTGGDEVRCALTTPTTLSGTLTFTNGSVNVTTSVDLTSEVQTGDAIRHPATNEAWWAVASVDAAKIVLNGQYWGTDGSGKTGSRMRTAAVTITADETVAVSGVSATNRLKISGGWNLSTQSRTGFTYIRAPLADIPMFYSITAMEFIEYSYFIVYSGQIDMPMRSYFHDIYAVDSSIFIYEKSILENVWVSNGKYPLYPMPAYRGGGYIKIKDMWIYSSRNDGPYFEGGNLVFVDNLNVFNQTQYLLYFYYISNVYFKNCTFKHQTSVDGYYPYGGVGNYNSHHIYFYNCVFDDLAGEIIPEDDYKLVPNIFFFIKCTFTNMNAFQAINIDSSEEMMVDALYTVVPRTEDEEDYEGFEIFREGGRIYLSKTEGVSGSRCLVFSPQRIWIEMRRFVGAFQIIDPDEDVALSVYMKKTENFDGEAYLYVIRNGCYLSKTTVTLTTDYVKQTVTTLSADLVEGESIALHVGVRGEELGSVFVDDFLGEAV